MVLGIEWEPHILTKINIESLIKIQLHIKREKNYIKENKVNIFWIWSYIDCHVHLCNYCYKNMTNNGYFVM